MKKLLSVILLLCSFDSVIHASQPLETETARLAKAGSLEADGTVEYQTSSEGTETSVPFAFEYGITNKLELLVEPVLFTAIRPKVGRKPTGTGDTEVTLTTFLKNETDFLPALAFAGEVKVPTAKDRLIGTGKADFNGTLIASKRFGKLDAHVNAGYTILGRPAGVALKNIFNFSVAGEFHLNKKWDVVAEVLNETSSGFNLGDAALSTNPNGSAEISGGETVEMIGGRFGINPHLFVALGVTHDSNDAILFRPGISYLYF